MSVDFDSKVWPPKVKKAWYKGKHYDISQKNTLNGKFYMKYLWHEMQP